MEGTYSTNEGDKYMLHLMGKLKKKTVWAIVDTERRIDLISGS
jgi:hypothetical protein